MSKSSYQKKAQWGERQPREQVSCYIFVLWCKWEKKLEGIIKMSLAFHLNEDRRDERRGQE